MLFEAQTKQFNPIYALVYCYDREDIPSNRSSASSENEVSYPVTWDKPQPQEDQSSTER